MQVQIRIHILTSMRIRIQEAKPTPILADTDPGHKKKNFYPKKYKKLKKFHVLNFWMFFYEG
jgi:hypothetical protein